MKINDVIRAGWIKRWGIVRTLREQNIAEHSFTVAMISEEICGRIGWPFDEGGGLQAMNGLQVLRWALWHDMAEVFTGDIPTPTKKKLRELAPEALEQVEDALAPKVAEIRAGTGSIWLSVVKLADYIEAISFLDREAGNGEAESVKELLKKQMFDHIDGNNSILRPHRQAIMELLSDMSIA